MNTLISNKIYVKNASLSLYRWCENNLIVTNPKWETLMRLGKQDQISRYHIEPRMALYVQNGLDLVIPFGCLYAIWDMIKDSPYELQLNQSNLIKNREDTITQPLYDYQEEAVQKMIEAKGGILIGGCGSGKTNCGLEIIKRIGCNALWLCHTKDLLNQTVKRIKQLYPNIPVGTITEGKMNMVNNGITISTIQTLVDIDPDLYVNNFGTVMTDECHHVASSPTLQKMFGKVITKIPARYKYGLTASDKRNDTLTKSMYATVGCNPQGEFEPTWRIDREDANTLTAKHEKVELNTPFSYVMLNDDGTFNYNNLVDYIAFHEERNKAICDKVQELTKENRKQLILCARVDQCKLLNEMLQERGVNSVLLIGKVSNKKRQEILNQSVDWQVIVATVSLAKEGLDVVDLDTLHLVSCLANKSDTVQSVGRIERVKEGKNEPIVYDYVDIKIPYLVSKWKKRVTWLRRR